MHKIIKQIKGFTLMEIMLSLIVMSIMAAFVLPNFNTYQKRQTLRKVGNDLIAIQGAVRIYQSRNPSVPCIQYTNDDINTFLGIRVTRPDDTWTYSAHTDRCDTYTGDASPTGLDVVFTISPTGPPVCNGADC